jgi:hypothetical protein
LSESLVTELVVYSANGPILHCAIFAGNFSVGRADGLISGIFLDDDISATGGFAENCALADCEHDMGLTAKDMRDLQDGWADMMNRTQARVLELGGFDWRELP